MAAPNIVTAVMINPQHLSVTQVTLTPSAVGAATVVEQTFTVSGLSLGDALQAADQIVCMSKATHQAGLGIGACRVTAANTLGIQFINPTAASITPTAGETYTFVVYRPYETSDANATAV